MHSFLIIYSLLYCLLYYHNSWSNATKTSLVFLVCFWTCFRGLFTTVAVNSDHIRFPRDRKTSWKDSVLSEMLNLRNYEEFMFCFTNLIYVILINIFAKNNLLQYIDILHKIYNPHKIVVPLRKRKRSKVIASKKSHGFMIWILDPMSLYSVQFFTVKSNFKMVRTIFEIFPSLAMFITCCSQHLLLHNIWGHQITKPYSSFCKQFWDYLNIFITYLKYY